MRMRRQRFFLYLMWHQDIKDLKLYELHVFLVNMWMPTKERKSKEVSFSIEPSSTLKLSEFLHPIPRTLVAGINYLASERWAEIIRDMYSWLALYSKSCRLLLVHQAVSAIYMKGHPPIRVCGVSPISISLHGIKSPGLVSWSHPFRNPNSRAPPPGPHVQHPPGRASPLLAPPPRWSLT